MGEVAFDTREHSCGTARGICDIELKLAFFGGIGQERNPLAVWRPRDIALGMQRVGSACADAPWRGPRFEIFYLDDRAPGTCPAFGEDCLHPGAGIPVR